ncbi:jumonji domain containing 6 [Lichtheimia corymbifera JMRC:FSU:9682]|nr:jumonji domain containing 6 [Lichtheimia corymbifera JMRC:FSU:9682]
MPSKRDSDRSQSPRKRTKYKESKGHRYDRKIHRAKTKARSELDLFQWSKWRFCKQDYWINPYVDVTPRIDYRSTSKEEFIAKYEEPNLPVVITHLTDEWPAQKYWTEKYLKERYGSHLFKIGEDDDDNNVYLKMKHFLHYSNKEGQEDDSPLYIFDSGFYKDRRRSRKSKSSSSKKSDQPNTLLDDYTVPSYFEDDLFRLTGERRRPPYRWLVIGGGRSGTG